MTVEQGIQEAVAMTLDGVADKFERMLAKQYIKGLEAKHQFELQYRLTLSRTVAAELKLLEKSQLRAEKWKARAEELEERNDTTPLAALKTVMEYSEFRGWANDEAVAAYRTLNDWLQFRRTP